MEDKEDKRAAQAEKIEEEKAVLTRQLMFQIFLSFLLSAAFYGITIFQNPDLKPNDEDIVSEP